MISFSYSGSENTISSESIIVKYSLLLLWNMVYINFISPSALNALAAPLRAITSDFLSSCKLKKIVPSSSCNRLFTVFSFFVLSKFSIRILSRCSALICSYLLCFILFSTFWVQEDYIQCIITTT